MVKPILNIADFNLQPRPAAFAATGPAAECFDARMGFIAPIIGAKQLGYDLTCVPPGKSLCSGDIVARPDGKPKVFCFISREQLILDYREVE